MKKKNKRKKKEQSPSCLPSSHPNHTAVEIGGELLGWVFVFCCWFFFLFFWHDWSLRVRCRDEE